MRKLLAALALLALASPALADTIAAPPSNTTIAIGNALTVVLTAAVPAVAAILSGALWKLWTKWGFQATAQDKANVESDLQTALAFGVSKAIPAIKASSWDNVDVHSRIVADAADYLLQRFPDRAAAIVTAANSDAGKLVPKYAALSDTLTARLPEAIAVAAASPATPPAPAEPPVPVMVVPLGAPALA
jgi:hypothetical protein